MDLFYNAPEPTQGQIATGHPRTKFRSIDISWLMPKLWFTILNTTKHRTDQRYVRLGIFQTALQSIVTAVTAARRVSADG